MKWTDFKWILKKWLYWISWSFHNDLQEIRYNFLKNTDFKTCLESTRTESRIWHFAQLQRYTREWPWGSQMARPLQDPPDDHTNLLHRTQSLLDLRTTVLPSGSLAQRAADQTVETTRTPRSGWQRHLLQRCHMALSGTQRGRGTKPNKGKEKQQ